MDIKYVDYGDVKRDSLKRRVESALNDYDTYDKGALETLEAQIEATQKVITNLVLVLVKDDILGIEGLSKILKETVTEIIK